MPADDVRDALKLTNGEQLVRQAVANAKEWKPGKQKEIELTTMRVATEEFLEDMRRGPAEKFPIGIPKLDKILEGGFDVGTMAVVGALSSHGKSAFAMQTAHFLISQMKISVAFISIEMTLRQLAARTFQHISDAPKANWLALMERLEEDSRRHFEGAAEFYLVEKVITLSEVEAAMRKCFEAGARVVFVDYIQRIANEDNQTHFDKVRVASALFCQLAKEYEGCVVCLAQLNKRVAQTLDPKISDIDFGTNVMHDADYMLLNLWPYKVNKQNAPDDYLVTVGKNRNGESDVVVPCKFNAPRQRITEKQPPKEQITMIDGNDSGVDFQDFS